MNTQEFLTRVVPRVQAVFDTDSLQVVVENGGGLFCNPWCTIRWRTGSRKDLVQIELTSMGDLCVSARAYDGSKVFVCRNEANILNAIRNVVANAVATHTAQVTALQAVLFAVDSSPAWLRRPELMEKIVYAESRLVDPELQNPDIWENYLEDLYDEFAGRAS